MSSGDLSVGTRETSGAGKRSLSVGTWIGLVVVYLLILQALSRLTTAGMHGVKYGTFPNIETIVRALILPVGLSVVLVLLVIRHLKWWRPVLRDDKPVRRWVWIVPAIMVATIAIGTNYKGVADKGHGFTLTFLAAALLVGIGEEGMYRGLGVVAFRDAGYSEGKVALWTCVVFGLSHATNIFTEGKGAVAQALVTVLAGYFFYLSRRVSGGLLVPILVHALWDFGLFSGAITDHVYSGAAAFVAADIILGILLLRGHKHIEPAQPIILAA